MLSRAKYIIAQACQVHHTYLGCSRHLAHIHHLVPEEKLLQQSPDPMIVFLLRATSLKLDLNLFPLLLSVALAVTAAVVWSINGDQSGNLGGPVCHLKADKVYVGNEIKYC